MINPAAELPASRWPAAFGVLWTAGFLFSVLGLRFGGDNEVDDTEWLTDSLEAFQGILAGLCLLCATLCFATAIHRELALAHACMSPLWHIEKPSNQKKRKIELKLVNTASSDVALGQKMSALINILLKTILLTIIVVLIIPTIVLVLATVPAWKHQVAQISNAIPSDQWKPWLRSAFIFLKEESMYRMHQTRTLINALVKDAVTKSTADPSAMDDAVDALRVLGRTAVNLIVRPFELWGEPLLPYVKQIVLFVWGWLCWQGGYLLPIRPYSMALGITLTNLSSNLAASVWSSFEYMPATVFMAMLVSSIVTTPLILWFLTPVVKQFKRCFKVPWMALAVGVGLCAHVACYFAVSLLRDTSQFLQTTLISFGPEWLSLSMYNDEEDFLTYRRHSSKTLILMNSMRGVQTFIGIWVFALFAIAARMRSSKHPRSIKPVALNTREEVLPIKRQLTSSDVDDSSRMSQVAEDEDEADEESAQENSNFRHTNRRQVSSSELHSDESDDESSLTAESKIVHPSQRSPIHSQTSEPFNCRSNNTSSFPFFAAKVESPAISGASGVAYQYRSTTKSDERTSSEPASDLIPHPPPSGPSSESQGCADALAVSYSIGKANEHLRAARASNRTKVPRPSFNLENKENLMAMAQRLNNSRKTTG